MPEELNMRLAFAKPILFEKPPADVKIAALNMARSLKRSRSIFRGWLLLAGLLGLLVPPAGAVVHDLSGARPEVRELIVKIRPEAAPAARAAAVRNAVSARKLRREPRRPGLRAAGAAPAIEVLRLADGVDMGGELARLRNNPAVAWAEPNYPLELFVQPESSGPVPNDFSFSKLDNLHNTGQNGGTPGSDISAIEAWAFETGSREVRVAVIDTGIDFFHQDLVANIWVNPGEIPGDGIDNDGNGYADDLHGFDFVSDDSDPMDDQEHGTHVAGTIGAVGNNEIGVTGVCWEVSLMALKAFNEHGEGRVSDAVDAIHYAVANGARIINASWGLPEKSFALEEAVDYAADAGVLVIAAAGNGRTDAPSYPAGYESVLSVGALDAEDERAGFSNHGPYVDLSAPGQGIFSTFPENGYGMASGTSMAAPHVSGVAALVLARFPHYGSEDVRAILINSTDPVKTDKALGRGRINAAKAVQTDQPLPRAALDLPAMLSGRVEIRGSAAGGFFQGYSLLAGKGRNPETWIEIASGMEPVSRGLLGVFDSWVLDDGPATIRLVVTNLNGQAASAIAAVELQNTALTTPRGGDILRAGEPVEVRGTSYGNEGEFRLYAGQGLVPEEWVLIASGQSQEQLDIPLGVWDTSAAEADQFYALKLVTEQEGRTNEFIAAGIYLDSFLKEGWPRYLYAEADIPITEWRNIRPADLDGNGTVELVLLDPANSRNPGRLLVLNYRGEQVWSVELEGAGPDIPAIADIDGDGRMEIFVENQGSIFGYSADGEEIPGAWPVTVEAADTAKVLADLDRDGAKELITYSIEWVMKNGEEKRELKVFDKAGTLLREWNVSWCGFTNDLQRIFPAVANFDEDEALEIVAVSGCNEIACFDLAREEPVWRAQGEGVFTSSPVAGDVDGNGELDIVITAAKFNGFEHGGVHVFTAKGELWNGWPVLERYSMLSPPGLGDLNGDGKLEICVSSADEFVFHVLQADGFDMEGWPVLIPYRPARSTPAIVDVDGDGLPDVVLAFPGHPSQALYANDPSWVGGIEAWNYAGEPIPLSPGPAKSLPMEVDDRMRSYKATAPLIVDLDGNGRLDVAAASIKEITYGTVSMFKERSSVYAWELPAGMPERGIDWAMLNNNPANIGVYSLPLVPTNTGPAEVTLAMPDRFVLSEDVATELRVMGNDLVKGGARGRITRITPPAHGRATRIGAAESILYRPEADYSGMDEFSYTMRDAAGTESTAAVLVRIKEVNDAPVALDQEVRLFKNGSVTVTYRAENEEDEELIFEIVQSPEHGELWNYPNVGNYQPFKGFYGTDSFQYTASDGRKESAPATVTIHIINSNNPPKVVEQTVRTKPNRAAVIHPDGRDQDGDPLVYEATTEPLHGQLETGGSSFLYTPVSNYIGTDFFFFRAHDGTEYSAEAKMIVVISPTNSPPSAAGSTVTVPPDRPSEVELRASDPDGDPLTYVITSLPEHGELSGEPPLAAYTPEPGYLGPDRVRFKVTDGQAESEEAELEILVARINHPPEAADMSITTLTNTPLKIGLAVVDEDGDEPLGVIMKGVSNGRLYGWGTNYIYEPSPSYWGPDMFTYKVWDGLRYSPVRTVHIYVTPVAEAVMPVFQGISVNGGAVELKLKVEPHAPFQIEISENLIDWEPLTGTIASETPDYTFSHTNAAGGLRFYRAATLQ